MPNNIPMHIILAKIKQLPSQVYNGLQFVLVLQGQIRVTINTKKFSLSANQFILINLNDIYAFEEDGANIVLILKVPFEYLRKECHDILQHQYHCYSENLSKEQHKYYEIRRMLIYMMLMESSCEEGYQLKMRASLFQLLSFVLENFKTTLKIEDPTFKSGKGNRIAAILNYIDENYKQPMTLSMIAEKEFVSVHYLSRYFKREMGVNFIDYLVAKRLNSSMMDLIYTEDSVLTIAFQNGFTNPSAFISYFKKKYQDTPNKFRQKHKENNSSSIKIQADYEPLLMGDIGGIPELLDYIHLYDRDDYRLNYADSFGKIDVNLDGGSSETLVPLEKIVNIAKCSDLLKAETQKQLEIIQDKLEFHYAAFQAIFGDGIFLLNQSLSTYGYEYSQAILFLQKNNLIPFIKLNISQMIIGALSPPQVHTVLTQFLLVMEKYFSKSYLKQWKFEVTATEKLSDEDALGYYLEIYKVLKEFSPRINIGFMVMQHSYSCDDMKIARNRLMTAIEHNCPPDFITFKADPNEVISQFVKIDTGSYQDLKGYHLAYVQQLKKVLEECNIDHLPLYMTEWNTIVGKNYIEFISFNRAALIVDTLASLSGQIKGVSFWLSNYNNSTIDSEAMISSLSLFHRQMVVKVAFPLLGVYFRLGNKILFQNENLIVTKNTDKDIVVMVFNPCLFNARYALDNNFIQAQRKNLLLEFQGVDDGRYDVKSFEFNLKYTSAINNQQTLHGLDTNQRIDDDMADHVKYVVSPTFSNYEVTIQQKYMMKLKLEHNAVTFYILKKLTRLI